MMARPASSLPGIGKRMPSGSELVSTIAATGMFEPVGLLDRQLLLVGVDHEDQVGHAAHVLDAAERLLELLALARQHQALLLGEARARRPSSVSSTLRSRWIEAEIVFQLVSMPPSQRELM